MLEFGGRCNVTQTTILRPYVAIGASFYPNNSSTTNTSIIADGTAISSSQQSIKAPDAVGNAEIGFQLYQVGGVEVKAEYEVSAASTYLSQSMSLRGAYHF